MDLPMALLIAVLFAGGTYMILRPNLIRVVLGLGLYSNAANLLLITVGGYAPTAAAPFVSADTSVSEMTSKYMMDPIPPDIILTAIVISFAVSALFLTTCYRVYLDHGTDNPQELAREDEIEAAHAASQSLPNLFSELAKPDQHALHERRAAYAQRGNAGCAH